MTRISITSIPGMLLGRSASVAGSVCASLRHGIWIISFFTDTSLASSRNQLLDHAIPGNQPRAFVPGFAERRGAAAVARERIDRVGERLGTRLADQSVDAVDDELVRPSGVGRRPDRLSRQERLQRDVAEGFIVWRVQARPCVAVELE